MVGGQGSMGKVKGALARSNGLFLFHSSGFGGSKSIWVNVSYCLGSLSII